jgi:beta-lactamase class A
MGDGVASPMRPPRRVGTAVPRFLRPGVAAAALLGGSIACAPAPVAPSPEPTPTLETRFAQRIAQEPGAEAAIWVEDLGTGATFRLADTVPYHPASTMKLPVMVTLVRAAESGAFALDDRILLQNVFRSIVDGSPYSLVREEDSDPALYDRVGAPISLRELNHRMIVRSSNLATNALIEALGADAITRVATSLGADGVIVRRGVEDAKAFAAGRNNGATARGLGRLLAAVERGDAASAAGTALMRATLLAQEFNDEIPAGVPAGTPVAHKTGWITGQTHDAAIVYPPGRAPFVLVVLTRGIADRATAQRLIADLAALTWSQLVAGR